MSTLYPALDGFAAPAKARPQLWRLILGLVLAVVIYALILFAMLAAAIWLSAPDNFLQDIADWSASGDIGPNPIEREIQLMAGGGSPTAVLVILATFAGMALGAMAAARWLHKRGLRTLTGPYPTLWRHFGIGILIAAPLLALSTVSPPYLDTAPALELGVWLTFLPMALALVALQTGAEELLFRGYLQQQLAARFRSPILWMVLPSVLFGLGHWNPGQFGDEVWAIVVVTTIVGLFAADLTARTGSIGAAWGLHFANNAMAILIVSLEGPLTGLSLWIIPLTPGVEDLLLAALLRDVAVIGLIWFAIRKALSA